MDTKLHGLYAKPVYVGPDGLDCGGGYRPFGMIEPATAVCYYPTLAVLTRNMASLTEADTCRRYVLPKLDAAGWIEQISEQKSFTDGRIVVAGTKVKRRPQKRAD